MEEVQSEVVSPARDKVALILEYHTCWEHQGYSLTVCKNRTENR
jgi:hypothetical protein